MSPTELVLRLEVMRAAGITNEDFTRLHHFSEKGRAAYLQDALSYFARKSSLRGNNLSLAERCRYVCDQLSRGRIDKSTLIDEALAKWPLNQNGLPLATSGRLERTTGHRTQAIQPSRVSESQQLGDAGEELVLQLLRQRGYAASLLAKNYPTYDIQASGGSDDYLVSVKVARTKQHVRLGSRNSVSRLSSGNFIFAILANAPSLEVNLHPGGYKLLILPATEVRDYALAAHDSYWAAKGKADGYSVMIKAYDTRHADVWMRWVAAYEDAWHLLPPLAK